MKTTSNYYFLCNKEMPQVASAFAPEGTKLSHELIADLEGLSELPFDLDLVRLTVGKKGIEKDFELEKLDTIWLDLQPNSLAWPIMSSKLKNLISSLVTGEEGINWLEAKVSGNGERHTYYIPRFQKKLDVLNVERTMFVGGTDHIIKPYFDLKKVHRLNVFTAPRSHNFWKITSEIYVSELVKQAILKYKLTGLAFEKTRVS